MINPTMFKEWCQEIHNSGGNVMSHFRAIVFARDFILADLPDIETRAKYIIEVYGR